MGGTGAGNALQREPASCVGTLALQRLIGGCRHTVLAVKAMGSDHPGRAARSALPAGRQMQGYGDDLAGRTKDSPHMRQTWRGQRRMVVAELIQQQANQFASLVTPSFSGGDGQSFGLE